MVLPWDIVADEALIKDPLPHEVAEQHQAPRLGIEAFQIGQVVALLFESMCGRYGGRRCWRISRLRSYGR
jgi:hypothetical protein